MNNNVICVMCHKEYPNAFLCDDNNSQGMGCSCFVTLNTNNEFLVVGCYGSLKHDGYIYMINDDKLVEELKYIKDSICDECIDKLLIENKLVMFTNNEIFCDNFFSIK